MIQNKLQTYVDILNNIEQDWIDNGNPPYPGPFVTNQINIDEAIQMAKDHGMGFILRRTTRNFKSLPDDLRKQLQPDKKFLYKYGKVLGGTHKNNEKILDIPR